MHTLGILGLIGLALLVLVGVLILGMGIERANADRAAGARRQIDRGLALALAGQVKIGLARNTEPDELAAYGVASRPWVAELEESIIRARAALGAIGLMLRNASHDADVDATLALDVQVQRDGSDTRLVMRPPTPE